MNSEMLDYIRMFLCLGTFLFCFVTISTIIRRFSGNCIEGIYEQLIILFGMIMYAFVALAAVIKFYLIINHDAQVPYEVSFANMFVDLTILLYLIYLYVQRLVFKKLKVNERHSHDKVTV